MYSCFNSSLGLYWIATILEVIAGLVVFFLSCADFKKARLDAEHSAEITRRARIEMIASMTFLLASLITMRGLWLGFRSQTADEAAMQALSNKMVRAEQKMAETSNSVAKVRAALPPRRISEQQREIFLEVLINSNNVSKVPIKVVVGETNKEADGFAHAIRNLLNEAGYGTNGEDIIRMPHLKIYPRKDINDMRTPSVFVIYSTRTPFPDNDLGGVRIWSPTAKVIASGHGQKNQYPPVTYLCTSDPNAILTGITEVLKYIGISVEHIPGDRILKPGEVGLFIPKQMD